jgi:hypothetical protein
MRNIVRDHDQVMDQRDRRDLFVERILGVRNSEMAPDMRRFLIERQDGFTKLARQPVQPTLEPLGLRLIATMANSLQSLA